MRRVLCTPKDCWWAKMSAAITRSTNLVGAMLRATPQIDPNAGFLAITSRASYQIVHKTANAGIAVIAAMSAPTDLAIRQAETAGITLIAFARDARMNVYSGRERLA